MQFAFDFVGGESKVNSKQTGEEGCSGSMFVLDTQYSWCGLNAARPIQTLAAIKVDEQAFKSFRSLDESPAGR